MDAKPLEQLVQVIDNKEQSKIGKIVKTLHLNDNSWLICTSLKRALLNQHVIQLSSGNKSINCSIIMPDLLKESENT